MNVVEIFTVVSYMNEYNWAIWTFCPQTSGKMLSDMVTEEHLWLCIVDDNNKFGLKW